MKNKSTNKGDRSTSTVDIGLIRKERIERFRASKRLKGVVISNIDTAINTLVDIGLDAENVSEIL